ncbi:hypothetical protein SCB71_09020 [Herbiconiux sp. KACC 21604]|uniref:hypothetical protein n=1 Tax=unclassified Herbiconiux TaxID=2618217 RepID=UPI0014914B5C|nr:hypothetical protein [Herbiconiux sp. SALV-R1]QJU53397.1 hypothetical protein HL652_06980 [Herbiconiux sp. SALV-R1]WPO88362.1 hypothetical protein SCB71_09020 [Herbiconiux sp. KACC 21604]
MTAQPPAPASTWMEHRRGLDRELVGWMRPDGDGFVAIDLLGRPVTDAVDWFDAETALDERGLGYLADPYELRLDSGHWLRVRLVEVTPQTVRVKQEDWGDINATQVYHSVPFPVSPEVLRPFRAG